MMHGQANITLQCEYLYTTTSLSVTKEHHAIRAVKRVIIFCIKHCLYKFLHFNRLYSFATPIPVVARSEAIVCGRSLAGIVGSNPTWGMEVSILRMSCVFRQRYLPRADRSSRGFLPSVVCLIQCNFETPAKRLTGFESVVALWENNSFVTFNYSAPFKHEKIRRSLKTYIVQSQIRKRPKLWGGIFRL